ncbi:MAG: sugar transferase [Clostridia bacterium]|nr:sugar transferase [Clostridia bacterium]
MYKSVKRVGDIIISLIGLLICWPFMLIVMLAIYIDSGSETIFKQERIGKDGKVFRLYKFRSMVKNAEHTGSGVYSFKGDARVTKVGKFIRKTSIDELPQLINVLKGDMSLIGPRPVLTYHPMTYDKYTDEQLKRFSVRPGITGWAQVNGRKTALWKDRIAYDIEYVENLSFRFDVKVFFKTIKTVLGLSDNENIEKTAVFDDQEQSVGTGAN